MPPASVTFEALAPMRLAAPFEALRDASDAILAASGARPRVFLANLGSLADFTPRATFAKNMFEAGGIEAVELPFPWGGTRSGAPPRVAAFKESGARLVCLCSTDAIYAEQAETTAKALAAAGATHIYLAGRPGDHETAFRTAGIGTFVHAGIDALATLKAAHAMLTQGRASRRLRALSEICDKRVRVAAFRIRSIGGDLDAEHRQSRMASSVTTTG